MLRESSRRSGVDIALGSVFDSAIDPGLPLGPELLRFVDAAVLRDYRELPAARAALSALTGTDFVREAAGVIANFEMMNRILDATGVAVSRPLLDLADELAVEVPEHLRGRG